MVTIDANRLQLGEGPGYDPSTDLLWWFDIPGRRLFLRNLSQGKTQVHDLPRAASAMAVTKEGRHVLMTEDGLCWRDPATGAQELYLAVEADNPATRSNDSRVHPSGAFWVSTMGWNAEAGAGSFYRVHKGKVERLLDGITIPNATCFSPDGRIAYFTDTPTQTIMRVETDAADGRMIGKPSRFVTGLHAPDGAVTDAVGNLWVAIYGTGEVLGFAPDGKAIGSFTLPAPNLTCPAFIGSDAGQMLVTSSSLDMTPEQTAAHPAAGGSFLIDLPFKGRFDPHADI